MQEVFTNSVLNLMRFVPSVSKSMLFQRVLCLLPRFWNCAIVQVGQLLHYLPYLHHLLSEVFCISLEHCHFLFLWSGLRKFLLISASIWGFFSTSQFRNGVFFFDKGPRSWNLTFLKCWLFRDSSGKRQNEDWTSTAYGPPIWSERPGGRALSLGGGGEDLVQDGSKEESIVRQAITLESWRSAWSGGDCSALLAGASPAAALAQSKRSEQDYCPSLKVLGTWQPFHFSYWEVDLPERRGRKKETAGKWAEARGLGPCTQFS